MKLRLFISCCAGICAMQMLPAFADIETTTVKTTTVTRDTSSPAGTVPVVLPSTTTVTTRTVSPTTTTTVVPIVLPATTSYILVDPITGNIKGSYDPMHGVLDTKDLVPGLVVIDQASGKIVASINSLGQTVDVISAPAFDTLVSSIDDRRNQIDKMITQSLSAGTIDTNQAAALRAQLDKITTQETAYKQNDNFLTYSEALNLATALNTLENRLVLLAHAPAVTPILGSKFMSIDGQVIMVVDDLDYRRMTLIQRVDDEYIAGRLSTDQVSSLKEQINAAAAFESKYKKNGELTPSKKEKVATKLDNIETQMNKDVAIINEKRARIGIRVQ